jgi:hypothetical protein
MSICSVNYPVSLVHAKEVDIQSAYRWAAMALCSDRFCHEFSIRRKTKGEAASW